MSEKTAMLAANKRRDALLELAKRKLDPERHIPSSKHTPLLPKKENERYLRQLAQREAMRQERRERKALEEERKESIRRGQAERKEAARNARDERRRKRMAKRDRHRRQDEFYIVGGEAFEPSRSAHKFTKPKRKRRDYRHSLYQINDKVTVWSTSAQKWFLDGVIKKIGSHGKVFVHYDLDHPEGLSRRWIMEADQPKFVRKEKKDSSAFQIPPPREKTPCRSPSHPGPRLLPHPKSEPIIKLNRQVRPFERTVLGEIKQPNFDAGTRPNILARGDKQPPTATKIDTPPNEENEFADGDRTFRFTRTIVPSIPAKPLEPDFGISDYDSDFTDDSEEEQEGFKRGRRIPTWARGTALTGAVTKQDTVDPEDIFGPMVILTCDLQQMFSKWQARQKYLKRKESANWTKDGLTRAEELGYKTLMGWV